MHVCSNGTKLIISERMLLSLAKRERVEMKSVESDEKQTNWIEEIVYLAPNLPDNVITLGYEAMKRLEIFENNKNEELNKNINIAKYHEFDGNEKFLKNNLFKYSNYNQTIKDNKKLSKVEREINRFDHCIGLRKLDFIKNEQDKIHYFEVRVDRIPTEATFIGISSSNINNSTPYRRIPVIAAWSITKLGQLHHPKYPITSLTAPTIGETVGILIDFKTKKWNGCIRIFHNKKEIDIDNDNKPFIYNLLSQSFIWENIPPLSLYIGAYYKSEFQFTIKQFPLIPTQYKHLYPPFYTEKLKINHCIKMLHNSISIEIIQIFKDFLYILDVVSKERNGWSWIIHLNEVGMNKKIICIQPCFADISNDKVLIAFCNKMIYCQIINICSTVFRLIGHINKREDIKIIFYIMAAFISIGIEEKLDNLGFLGGICCVNKEYQIARKMNNKLLSCGINDDLIYRKSLLMEKWEKMCCNNCGKKGKLRSCKGCMKIAYCCRYCQKKHWKYKHKLWCDRVWYKPYLYKILQNCLD